MQPTDDLHEARPRRALPGWLRKPLTWLVRGLWIFARVLLLAWAALAIHYSNLPWPWVRTVLAIGFLGFGIWAFWVTRRPRMPWVYAGAYLLVVIWWILIPASHDRPWRPEVAVMPRAVIDGDRVLITGVRHFEYRSRDDFTIRYEERELSLAHLTGVDFFVSHWAPGPIGHTFLSFTFDNALPLCISIETRPEVGEGFSPIASLFKQFELIYVVGDERDLVRVRTDHRDEDVYLYPLLTPPESARRLLLVYLERINELADRAEFYNLLTNSCTINIIRYANAAGRVGRFDIRHLLNGLVIAYLYASGRLDTTLPLEELRERSRINDAALAAGDAKDFSERIRADLPVPQP